MRSASRSTSSALSRSVSRGTAVILIGVLAMSGLPLAWGLLGFLFAFVILALAYQLFLASLKTAVMDPTSPATKGMTSGVLNLSRNCGFIVGASGMSAMFGSTVHWQTASVLDGQNVRVAMAGTFVAAACFILCALPLARKLGTTPKTLVVSSG